MLIGHIARIRESKPIVHNITNYVTVNDCANITLAIGASPIMADDEMEVEEIVSICQGLVINIGTLNQRIIQSMVLAGKKANALGIPVILDPVGNGASRLRTETTNRLLREVKLSVIRGNISEILMAYAGTGNTKGVDADATDMTSLGGTIRMARQFSRQTGAIIAVTGERDIVSSENESYIISNGHRLMGSITGTGCMLTSLIGAFCAGGEPDVKTVAAAVAAMGLSGETAYSRCHGTGSFRTQLMDAISNMDDHILTEGMKLEKVERNDEALCGHGQEMA